MTFLQAMLHWWHGDKVLLWTDGLLLLLAVCVAAVAVVSCRSESLRSSWRRVFRRSTAAAATVIFATYLIVALLDSIHYFPLREPQSSEAASHEAAMISVLDDLLTPLRTRAEESYSAPLAIFAVNSKAFVDEDGNQARHLPRLKYGGAHLQSPDRHQADILDRTLVGLGQALLGWMVLSAGVVSILAYRRRLPALAVVQSVLRGDGGIEWRAMLLVSLALLLALGLTAALTPAYHLLGTDKVGNDVLYLCLKSVRTGLLIGTLTTLVAMPFAILLGIAAGYWRGRVDDLIQYLYTTLDSIPDVLLIAAMVLVVQSYMAGHADAFSSVEYRSDLRLLLLCCVLGITRWTGLCRLLRAETMKLRELDYVQAARALGSGHSRLLIRTIMPNVMHLVLITAVMQFSGLVLAEAVLSYIGIGVDPGMHSWGNMINAARLELAREPVIWWTLAGAMSFMFVLVLSANLVADAVRDAFDPRLRALVSP